MTRRARWLVMTGLVALAGVAVYRWHDRPGLARPVPPPDATAPAGERIRVEVLNATTTRGLARRATFLLRGAGFDVVDIGTAGAQQDSTLVLDRTHHSAWARRVATALGGATVEDRPDSTLYVDVTVLLGRSWHPPPEPFRP